MTRRSDPVLDSIAAAVASRDDSDRTIRALCVEAKRNGVSVAAIARVAGVDRSTIYRWEES